MGETITVPTKYSGDVTIRASSNVLSFNAPSGFGVTGEYCKVDDNLLWLKQGKNDVVTGIRVDEHVARRVDVWLSHHYDHVAK